MPFFEVNVFGISWTNNSKKKKKYWNDSKLNPKHLKSTQNKKPDQLRMTTIIRAGTLLHYALITVLLQFLVSTEYSNSTSEHDPLDFQYGEPGCLADGFHPGDSTGCLCSEHNHNRPPVYHDESSNRFECSQSRHNRSKPAAVSYIFT